MLIRKLIEMKVQGNYFLKGLRQYTIEEGVIENRGSDRGIVQKWIRT